MALMAAVFVGVAVAKWRSSRHPHAQGFVEVDQVSQEILLNQIYSPFKLRIWVMCYLSLKFMAFHKSKLYFQWFNITLYQRRWSKLSTRY